jgi:pimeloyl-ACP methyl ester carboxylesterase
MWFSRPGMGALNDPARWQPAFREGFAAPAPSQSSAPEFAVFFVHPTSYFDNRNWNAPLGDDQSQQFAGIFVRGMGSAFNRASEIWAPRYRQATFGSFLDNSDDAHDAMNAAYADIEQAFDYFLQNVDAETPIVLAGHSQGAMHVLRLLRNRVADSDLQPRIAMVYAIGWPISIEHDLPELPLPACENANQGGCIVTWASLADGGDAGMMLRPFSRSAGFDGELRGEGPILCVNPLNGVLGGSAEAALNLGTLVPSSDLTTGDLVPAAVPARCREDGMLMIGDPPEMGAHVLPQNNYHVYDIPLFWANLQADVGTRVAAWKAAQ